MDPIWLPLTARAYGGPDGALDGLERLMTRHHLVAVALYVEHAEALQYLNHLGRFPWPKMLELTPADLYTQTGELDQVLRKATRSGQPPAMPWQHLAIPFPSAQGHGFVLIAILPKLPEAHHGPDEAHKPQANQELKKALLAEAKTLYGNLAHNQRQNYQAATKPADPDPLALPLADWADLRTRYEELQRKSQIGLWEIDLATGRLYVSPYLKDLLGQPKQPLTDLGPYLAMLTPDEAEALKGALQAALVHQRPFRLRHRLHQRRGTSHLVYMLGYFRYNEQGEPSHLVGLVQNVSKELAYHDELQRLASVLKLADSPILAVNRLGQVDLMNPALTRYLGYTEDDFRERTAFEVLMGLDHCPDEATRKQLRARYHQFFQRLRSDVEFREELQVMDKYGRIYWFLVNAAPSRDVNGHTTGYIFVLMDVTASRRAKESLADANALLEHTMADLNDSIAYAQRIQHQLLPDLNALKDLVHDVAWWYRPRDVVSGDFYWAHCVPPQPSPALTADQPGLNPGYLLAVGDCTGHGVPGSLLSILGIGKLQAAASHNLLLPHQLLACLDGDLRAHLAGNGQNPDLKDGMDVGLLYLDAKSQAVHYSGANRPLVVQPVAQPIYEVRGTRRALGHDPLHPAPPGPDAFEAHQMPYQPGTRLFLFSDGLTDAIGGPQRRKFGRKRLLECLEANRRQTLADQVDAVRAAVEAWVGHNRMVDDVVLVGLVL